MNNTDYSKIVAFVNSMKDKAPLTQEDFIAAVSKETKVSEDEVTEVMWDLRNRGILEFAGARFLVTIYEMVDVPVPRANSSVPMFETFSEWVA